MIKNREDLNLLITALGMKRSGLFLVEADTYTLREEIELQLRIALGNMGKRLIAIDVKGRGEDQPAAEFIAQTLRGTDKEGVAFIYNLDYGIATREAKIDLFRRLNFQREALASFNLYIIFLISRELTDYLIQYADDLYDWMTQRYAFEEVLEERVDLRLKVEARRAEKPSLSQPAEEKRIIQELERQLKEAGKKGRKKSYALAHILDPLAAAYYRAGDYSKALEILDQLLTYYRRTGDRQRQAEILNRMGDSLSEISTGNRADNLQRAISAYREALTIHTKEALPMDYAMTQNNLGLAYADLPTGDRADNLHRAISAYREALTIFTPYSFPEENTEVRGNLERAISELEGLSQPATLSPSY